MINSRYIAPNINMNPLQNFDTVNPMVYSTAKTPLNKPTKTAEQEQIENIKNLENTENTISAEQQALWNREDKIRKEIQEREDNAYQRAVKDMKAAGIDPNLMGVTPSSSSGGITSATAKQFDRLTMFKDLLMQEIQNEFQMSENTKDRLNKLATTIIEQVNE